MPVDEDAQHTEVLYSKPKRCGLVAGHSEAPSSKSQGLPTSEWQMSIYRIQNLRVCVYHGQKNSNTCPQTMSAKYKFWFLRSGVTIIIITISITISWITGQCIRNSKMHWFANLAHYTSHAKHPSVNVVFRMSIMRNRGENR